jgi:DUF1680 family protein
MQNQAETCEFLRGTGAAMRSYAMDGNMTLSDMPRRTFLAAAASVAIAPRGHATPAQTRLKELGYSQVKLTGGPMGAQYDRMHAAYLKLDEDRLLKVYRQRVGMPAPGADMGGWYDADGFVPGHLIGQFISGLARIHATTGATTGDKAAADKAARLVDGYAATFAKDGNPFASPKASTTWPCYILDKYEIGLIDAATLAGIAQAKALLPQVIEGAMRFIPAHTYDRTPDSPKQAPYDEPYILPENLFKTYELTGDSRFLSMAKTYLLDDEFFNPLAEGRNILPGKHGYSHVIALSSGAKAYEVLGDAKYLRAIQNAWDMLEQTQEYASGAWAPKEAFVTPHSGELASSLETTHDHFETPCGYYAHSKLARYLLGFTGEARYGDGLERVLLNTILGATDPTDDGEYFYYSDYHDHAKKRFYQRKWPCCAGTLLQSVADYPICLYFAEGEGIAVNLYASSEVRWNAGSVPVKLTQHTAYPESETVELVVEPKTPAQFAVALRIPGWLESPARISVNGKPANVSAERGAFARISRKWKAGDTISLTMPFSFRTVAIDDKNPDMVAVMRGPVMMSVMDPPAELAVSAAALKQMSPVAGKPLHFDCDAHSGKVRLKPFYQVINETYSTYFKRIA